MLIDSNRDGPAASADPYGESTAFEEEEAEYDPSVPYEPISQMLDLSLGVEILHFSFPHLPSDLQYTASTSVPKLLNEKIVMAVVCSDFSVRVLSVPLAPPAPQGKRGSDVRTSISHLHAGDRLFGERMVILTGSSAHRSIPNGVSLSYTSCTSIDTDDIAVENDDEQVKSERKLSRTGQRSRSRSQAQNEESFEFLIASYSSDLSGLLLIHRLPLDETGADVSIGPSPACRTHYLTSPAVSIQFSSALYPASRHAQLLVAETKGVVRILDCLSGTVASQFSWLVSLYTDFQTPTNTLSRRKPIIDARWLLGARAILVLLADGEWGVWDLDNVGPRPSAAAGFHHGTLKPNLTAFAIDGWVGSSLKARASLKSSTSANDLRSKLAPMTPGARKLRQEALFTDPTLLPEGPARGGLDVLLAADGPNSRADDESVLLWHGASIITIPSFFTHWQNKVRASGNMFGSGAKGEAKTISNIQLGGDSRSEVSLIPRCSRSCASSEFANQQEILITGGRRINIVTPPLTEQPTVETSVQGSLSASTDQQMLAKGELDVTGMDRILAGMSNGHTPRSDLRVSGHTKGSGLLLS